MSITIELPAELESRLEQAAMREGTDLSSFVRSALEEKLWQTDSQYQESGRTALPERPTADEIRRALAEGTVSPSEAGLLALREIARRQESRSETSGEDTQRMLRQARAGGMYGLEPTDE